MKCRTCNFYFPKDEVKYVIRGVGRCLESDVKTIVFGNGVCEKYLEEVKGDDANDE